MKIQQLAKQPRLFAQKVQLTNGAVVTLTTTLANRPVLKLTKDTYANPIWSWRAQGGQGIEQNARLARFQKRFSDDDLFSE